MKHLVLTIVVLLVGCISSTALAGNRCYMSAFGEQVLIYGDHPHFVADLCNQAKAWGWTTSFVPPNQDHDPLEPHFKNARFFVNIGSKTLSISDYGKGTSKSAKLDSLTLNYLTGFLKSERRRLSKNDEARTAKLIKEHGGGGLKRIK